MQLVAYDVQDRFLNYDQRKRKFGSLKSVVGPKLNNLSNILYFYSDKFHLQDPLSYYLSHLPTTQDIYLLENDLRIKYGIDKYLIDYISKYFDMKEIYILKCNVKYIKLNNFEMNKYMNYDMDYIGDLVRKKYKNKLKTGHIFSDKTFSKKIDRSDLQNIYTLFGENNYSIKTIGESLIISVEIH